MKKIRNLTITSSIFILLTGCTGNQSFSELNKNILDTGVNLLQTSKSISDSIDNAKGASDETVKTSKKRASRTSTAKNTNLRKQLFDECIEARRTKLRFDMGKSIEQINAEKAREQTISTRFCTCEVEYDVVAAQKMMALGYDGTQKSADKLMKDPAKQKKIHGIIGKLGEDKQANCRSDDMYK